MRVLCAQDTLDTAPPMNRPPDTPEDDGTVIRPTPPRPAAGAGGEPSRTAAPVLQPRSLGVSVLGNALPLGTRLGEFTLTRVIGEGGFGIVYEAQDTSLERRVAVKEYFPAELAERLDDLRVSPVTEDDTETFRKGLVSFINEAKILASFEHPSLVKVYRFWEANDTAYMVMPCYEGPTLQDALRKLRQPPDEAWLRQVLDPLTEALAVIHDAQVFHRDIAPDNILLLAGSGRPLLLDFGAARRVIQDAHQKAPTAIVKPGYAPVEQYSEVHMKQGPWSDVYALSAVLHLAITGKKPPAAIARLAGDAYQPLSTLAAGRYSPELLRAIDRGLIVKPTARTQGMDAFRADMGLPVLPRGADGRLLAAGRSSYAAETRVSPPGTASTGRHDGQPLPDRKGRAWRQAAWGVGIGSGVFALGLAVWWLLAAPAVPVQVAAPAAAPVEPAAASAAGLAAPGLAAPVPPAGDAPGLAAAPAPAGVRVIDEFVRIQAQSTPGPSVRIDWKSSPSFRIQRQDLLVMDITSSEDGYLYVLAYTPDDVLFQYFPNTVTRANLVRAQQTVTIPRTVADPVTKVVHEGIVLTDPPGKGHVLVIVSRHPRDFSLLGKRVESIYPLFPVGPDATLIALQLGNERSIYLGQVQCPGAQPCEDSYWATTASFDILP
jgi:serine/threonine protein kinase